MAYVFMFTSLYMLEKHVVLNVPLLQKIKYVCKKPSHSSAPIPSLFQSYNKTKLKYNEREH